MSNYSDNLKKKATSSFFEHLLALKDKEPYIEKTAERIMLKSFMTELDKLASPWQYAGDVLKASLAGELGSEVVHRMLYGDKAQRDPSQILKDSLTGSLLHAPFAAAAHYGPAHLTNLAAKAGPGTLGANAANFGAKGLEFLGHATSPVGTTGIRMAIPAINYAMGDRLVDDEEERQKKLRQKSNVI